MKKICIVGLGYVGLPLAVAFSRKSRVVGFDIKKDRVDELKRGVDSTLEITSKDLRRANILFTDDPVEIKTCDFIIVAVPTPITTSNRPNLKPIESASEIVGKNLKKGSIIVYESTVYPGVTEELCVPILEKNSGMKCGVDFKVGYSPERINPGDKSHTVDKIIKVVSGMDKQSTDDIAKAYGQIIKAGVFKARNIKTAEAAKVIENIQRDLNIALMNELSIIFEKMGINTYDVLKAASTKWNFHKYSPGLVGGHCIGVDPYYLTYKAQMLGYIPQIILAGRKMNDEMHKQVVFLALKGLSAFGKSKAKVLILGLSFKENVKDIRNSRAKQLISELKEFHMSVFGHDPLLDNKTVEEEFGIKNFKIGELKDIDLVIVFSPHSVFESLSFDKIKRFMSKNPIMIDIKKFYDEKKAREAGFLYVTL